MLSQKRKTDDRNFEENEENLQPNKKRKSVVVKDEDEILDCSQQNPDFDINSEAEVGIVERVSVTNFMCHKKLEVSLGANVNFIIGRNGSGKSAILTALIVGLGGKAANTSRGSSLKGFIKEGCTYCTVVIKLRNRGSDAFKHEEYGDSIIIERRLSIDGASSYKLKAANGSVISNKKDELLGILDQYNIQIDNPVSILTQDTARSFLNTSNPKDKYQFFLKATQLEQMSQDYQRIIEEQERIKLILDKKKKELPELAQQVKLHEERYKDMQQVESMKQKVIDLKEQLVWAFVNDKKAFLVFIHSAFDLIENLKHNKRFLKENVSFLLNHFGLLREVNEKHSEQANFQNLISGYQHKLDKYLASEDAAMISYQDKAKEYQAFQEEVETLVNHKRTIHTEHKLKKDAVKFLQDKKRKNSRDIHQAEKDLKTLLDRIEEIRETAQRDFESERFERESMIKVKKDERSSWQSKLNTSVDTRKKFEIALTNTKEHKYKIGNEINNAKRAVDNKRSGLVKLEDAAKNRFAVYGQHTAAVIQAIDVAHKQGKFNRKPVGPIGSLLKLKDPKWAIAVEQNLGKTMVSYACHDGHDMRVLKDIFRSNCRGHQPPIVLSSFSPKRYDVSQSRPHCSYPTVLDVLEIENDVVFNTIVDQCGSEQVLLIEEGKTAQQVIWFQRPHNATRAITMEGHDVLGGRSSKYYTSKKKEPSFLQADLTATVKRAESELIETQKELANIQHRATALETDLRRDNDEYMRVKRVCSQQQDEINRLTVEIQELEAIEEEKLPDVDTLKEEVKEHELLKLKLKEDCTAIESELSEKKALVEEHQQSYHECEEKCQVAKEKLEKLAQEQHVAEEEVRKLKEYKKYYQEKITKNMKEFEEAVQEHERLKAAYEDMHSQALNFCNGKELDVKRTVASLESEITKAEKRINNEEARRGNSDEVKSNYLTALERYTEADKKFKNCHKFRKGLCRAVLLRVKRYEEFQTLLQKRVVFRFGLTLLQQGYTGMMIFNRDKETLRIELIEKAMRRRGRRYQNFQTFLTKRARMYFGVLLSQRGYTGKMTINHDEETLVIQVNVENIQGVSTKDSKSLSGGERSFSTICFIMALWQTMESPFRCLDEFDVFMDMLNRKIAMTMLLEAAKETRHRQYILLTPQDMSQYRGGSQVRIFKLQDPERGQQTLPY